MVSRSREGYLAALIEVQQQLLTHWDTRSQYPTILKLLGQASGACRTYLSQVHRDDTGKLVVQQLEEWCAEGIVPKGNNLLLHTLSYEKFFPRWLEVLQTGGAIAGIVNSLPPIEREILFLQNVFAILVLPLQVNGEFAGFASFEQCEPTQPWDAAEIDWLRLAIEAVGHKLSSQHASSSLQESESRFRDIFQQAGVGIFQSEIPSGRILLANQKFASLLGYDWPDLAQLTWQEITHPDDLEVERATLQKLLSGDLQEASLEKRYLRKDGSYRWVILTASLIAHPNSNQLLSLGVVEDCTARRQAREQLEYLATHDSLTDLANRPALTEQIATALTAVRRKERDFFAVLFVDLNRFKLINDSLGHHLGDRLLVAIARQIEMYVGSAGVVARIGGDEFAILIEEAIGFEEVAELADCIQEGLGDPFWLEGQEVVITANVGIALSHHTSTGMLYETPEDLLRDAFAAMSHAKYHAPRTFQLFDSTMRSPSGDQLQTEVSLRRAIFNNQLCLYYQPIISLKTGQIVSFEALVRWQHPERGLIFPDEFIPLAESTGLIIPLGEWVLEAACQQLKSWQQQEVVSDRTSISVNVAARQLARTGLLNLVQTSLKKSGLAASCLCLEITESAIMDNVDLVTNKLNQLKNLGIKLCIDDFGTGYSSFSRLHAFPIDTLKIDRSFIPKANQDGSWEIVQTIVNLAKGLTVSVVVEGIETTEQHQFLKTLECEFAQGYLFGRPLDETAIVSLLNQNPVW